MKKLFSLLLALVMVAAFAACGNTDAGTTPPADSSVTPDSSTTQPDTPVVDGETIKIGVLAPLTGSVSQYGIAANNGIMLAAADVNANGGVLGKQIELVTYDEQGDVSEAVNAYIRLVQQDEVVAIVGDVTTKPTIAVAQEAANDGIPMITATGTGAEITEKGENIFRACFIDPYQGEIMANYAAEKLGAKTAAVLYDTGDDYSSGIAEAFRDAAVGLGVEVVNYEGYSTGTVDFNAALTLIQTSNPDVIMVPSYYEDAGKIMTQARGLGITAKFMGSDGWDGVENQIDPSKTDVLIDSFYCSQYSRQSDDPAVQGFIARYKDAYGIEENMFAVLGYDAMMIMASAIETAGTIEYGAVVSAMAITEYAGLTGTTTFDEKRNPQREAYITVFENGESQFLETYSFS